MPERLNQKLGAIAAIAGALLLLVGTFLHPMGADPNDPLAAFAEYAADQPWVASHLIQLGGLLLMVFALIILQTMLAGGRSSAWAYLGSTGAVVSLSVAGALQAVDGIALKVMVDRWAAASGPEKEMLFHAAFGVRQIEIGLASILGVLLGITVTIYGAALIAHHGSPRWLGWLAIAGGIPTVVASVIIAYTGFSGVAMTINMAANALLLVWMMTIGVWMWRQPSLDVSRVGMP